jgi:hypothetical protein
MRNLKLFESFESDALNSVYRFVSKKIDKNNADRFIAELKDIISNSYDIPLSQVKNDAFQYLSSKKALKITKGQLSNPWGVYALKFWFSLEEGFLCVSGVGGSEVTNYGQFSDRHIDFLKSERGLETGTLKPAKLGEFSHGDWGVAFLTSDESPGLRNLYKFRLFIDGGHYYAIQDYKEGGYPSTPDWREWGNHSWDLGKPSDPGTDHQKLHLYKEGPEQLSVISDVAFENMIQDGKISSSRMGISLDKIKSADFAIILYPDALFDYQSFGDIQKSRKEKKLGATALLSDKEIKRLNIERYLIKSLEIYGLSETSIESDFKKISNLISSMYCSELILFSLISDEPSRSLLIELVDLLKQLVETEYKRDTLMLIKEMVKRGKSQSKAKKDYFIGSYDRVVAESEEKTKELIDRINSISNITNNSIRIRSINSISEILILRQDLLSTRNFIHEIIGTYFSVGLKKIVSNYKYNDSDVSGGIHICNEEIEKDFIQNHKGLDIIEAYVKKTFT